MIINTLTITSVFFQLVKKDSILKVTIKAGNKWSELQKNYRTNLTVDIFEGAQEL